MNVVYQIYTTQIYLTFMGGVPSGSIAYSSWRFDGIDKNMTASKICFTCSKRQVVLEKRPAQ
jgi:hypothetical protein